MSPDTEPQGDKISRRKLVFDVAPKAVLVAAGLAVFGADAGPEQLQPLPSHILSLDMQPEGSTPFIQSSEPISNQTILKDRVGENYWSADAQTILKALANKDQTILDVVSENPIGPLSQGFMKEKEGHGELVVSAMESTFRMMGHSGVTIQMEPVQKAINGIRVSYDDGINPTLWAQVDPSILAKQIKNHPNLPIISMPFPVGESGFTFVGWQFDVDHQKDPEIFPHILDNKEYYFVFPYTPEGIPALDDLSFESTPEGAIINRKDGAPFSTYKVFTNRTDADAFVLEQKKKYATKTPVSHPHYLPHEAYTTADAEKNLTELYELAQQFPDRLFVAAIGNERVGNIDNLIKDIRANTPNLLLIGEVKKGKTKEGKKVFDRLGPTTPDIYVDVESITGRKDGGSSQGVGIISAVANKLYEETKSIPTTVALIKKLMKTETDDLGITISYLDASTIRRLR